MLNKIWFDFLYSFVWDTSHSKQNLARCYRKCAHVCTLNSRYSCHILIKLEFCPEIFEKALLSSIMKFRPVGAVLFHEHRRTERQARMTKLIVTFRDFSDARNEVTRTGKMTLSPYMPVGTEFTFTRKLTYTASCAHSNSTSRVFFEKPVITQLLRYSKQGRTVAVGINIFVSSVWGLLHLTVLAARVSRGSFFSFLQIVHHCSKAYRSPQLVPVLKYGDSSFV
jgi:hypothetical protein